MIGVSLWEFLVVLMVALVVIRPAKLPEAMQAIGLLINKARRYYQMGYYQWHKALDAIESKKHDQNLDPPSTGT